MVKNEGFDVNKFSHRLGVYLVFGVTTIGIMAMFFAGFAALVFTTGTNNLPEATEYFWRAPLSLTFFGIGFGLWYQLMMFWHPDDVADITEFFNRLRSLRK